MGETGIEKVLAENEKLIHYHMRRLGIYDPNGEYFAEGQYALWKAAESYDESLGSFSSYISWKIRNALIDYIRKVSRREDMEKIYKEQIIHHDLYLTEDHIEDDYLWNQVRSHLTENQWKWIYYYIIHDYPVDQIAAIEGVTKDAVKNWGRHARNKLKEKLKDFR